MKFLRLLETSLFNALSEILQTEESFDLPELTINTDQRPGFGDISTPCALHLAKRFKQNPKQLAEQIIAHLMKSTNPLIANVAATATLAGPGFINFVLTDAAWQNIFNELIVSHRAALKPEMASHNVLIEFVSANPTGPLHLAHGRNAIIGDVLARIMTFCGHRVHREFYVNDAGSQIFKLGASLRAHYLTLLGIPTPVPEDGYAGQYLIDVAQQLFAQDGDAHREDSADFFANYARNTMLELIKQNLTQYNVNFDRFTSEKSLYQSGAVQKTLDDLTRRGFVYELDGALWLKSTEFGDDKDRVLRKADGEMTYITPDIAYYAQLFSENYDQIINILGQDHHGYVVRRNAALQALGLDIKKLSCILYQLVLMKKNDAYVRMSKRAGNFEKLSDVIDIVTCDVARYFFLNRKADAHLELDLEQALKRNDENPVYYIQYAYVRTGSVLAKAAESDPALATFIQELQTQPEKVFATISPTAASHELLKKIICLPTMLKGICTTHQTHTVAYYAHELASLFHSFYANNRVVIANDLPATRNNLALINTVRMTLSLCLDLLGLSQPERM